MSAAFNCWLLLEKSDDTRISKSISSYNDKTGKEYNYDSLVPNHKNLHQGNLAILRKENQILGYGVIGVIHQQEGLKHHKRCPACKSTDVRERKNRVPKWKCGKCGHEFSTPEETASTVVQYHASIESFVRFDNPPSVESVKGCAFGEGVSSQLSILNLDPQRLRLLFSGTDLPLSDSISSEASPGQGFGLSSPERKAVELHAMAMAVALYHGMGWEVVDKSATCPFDLLARKDDQQRFIEVKGSIGNGLSVLLTHGEVFHAKEHAGESVLVVVANIQLSLTNDKWFASGGKIVCHEHPWIIVESSLQPTQFRYTTPFGQLGRGAS